MPAFHPASDQALLVTVPHSDVLHLLRAFEAARIAGVQNLHPAYGSLLIRFDSLVLSHAELEEAARTMLQTATTEDAAVSTVEIPVCYEGSYAPDLESVAGQLKLAPERVVELHSGTIYTVYFLGFVPGYAYLGELPRELHIPRLSTPRTKVPVGSVAIANAHTGVYPLPTPGGWRLIGRTPVRLFDPNRPSMSLLEIGQRVRFVPITEAEFTAYAAA